MHLKTGVSPACSCIRREGACNALPREQQRVKQDERGISKLFKQHTKMKTITIEGQLRTGFGKSHTRELRSQELVPGVIYGGAQEINFYAPAAAFKNLVY